MPVDRQATAMRVALEYAREATPEGMSDSALHPICERITIWVFDGGRSYRPTQEELTAFVRQTVAGAVEAGLAHAYGDAHRGQIDPGVIARLARLSF